MTTCYKYLYIKNTCQQHFDVSHYKFHFSFLFFLIDLKIRHCFPASIAVVVVVVFLTFGYLSDFKSLLPSCSNVTDSPTHIEFFRQTPLLIFGDLKI